MDGFPKLILERPTVGDELTGYFTRAADAIGDWADAVNAWADAQDRRAGYTRPPGGISESRQAHIESETQKKGISGAGAGALRRAVRELLKLDGVLAVEVSDHVVRVYTPDAGSLGLPDFAQAGGLPIVYHLSDASSTIYTARKGVPE